MLSPRLQEVKEKIEAKSSYARTEKEKELLSELEILEKLITNKSISLDSTGLEERHTQITSGPGGCPCCGK
jgi:hypothetical protein